MVTQIKSEPRILCRDCNGSDVSEPSWDPSTPEAPRVQGPGRRFGFRVLGGLDVFGIFWGLGVYIGFWVVRWPVGNVVVE